MVFRWAVIVFLILHVIERVQWSASGQKWNIVMRIWNSIYSKTRLYRVSDRRFLSVFTTCNLVTWSEKSFRFNCQFFKSVFAITVVYCSKKRGYTHDMNLYIYTYFIQCVELLICTLKYWLNSVLFEKILIVNSCHCNVSS